MGQKKGVATPLAEKGPYTKMMIAAGSDNMDLRFDAYESRLRVLSRTYLHA
jgi:hypothetical protein